MDSQAKELLQRTKDAFQTHCFTLMELEHEHMESLKNMTNTSVVICPRVWDTMACWPPTLPNHTAWMPCPDYFHDMQHNIGENATRFCTENGTWFKNLIRGEMREWTNYSACNYIPIQPVFDDSVIPLPNITERELRLAAALPYLKALTVTGYSISLISLLVAITILLGFKRLYCPRNTLHINLFISFIFRAIAAIVSRSDFLANDSHYETQNKYYEENSVACRMGISAFHYFMMANYFWIFIEGCYLNSIMSFSVFTDHSKIWPHIVGGWVPPIVFVGVWAIVKRLTHNYGCWRTNVNDPESIWIWRGPITVTIVMNFLFFLNIGRIIFIQFKNQTNLREQQSSKLKYRKLAKATLVLLAVFGIHFFLLIIVERLINSMSINPDLEITWLVVDLSFTSFQGLIAATLLCFANGEVRNELGRLIFRHRAALQNLRRSSSHMSTTRCRSRQNSGHTLDRVESLRCMPITAQTPNGPANGGLYSPLSKTTVSLKLPPQVCNPSSCESLYIAHTAENTAHNTAHNSDEELEHDDTVLDAPMFMRQVSNISNTHTLLGSRSSNGSVYYKNH